MLKLTVDREYKAAIYLRLSKDDGYSSFSGSKYESNSISNQRLLIQDFLKNYPEICVVKEYCDDGFSGTTFDRPQFQQMMEDVRSGKIDCIVVKDLSRFGREYIDTGRYIQKIFPMLGVRFIAINDHYDNAQPGTADNEIVLPFKNLMNDSYCRDISIKIRTNLDSKRKNGEYVGSWVVYGYLRDPDDKHKLIIDPEAAPVVQDVFRWKIEGLSPAQIAKRLNENGVLSPLEYKKAHGSKLQTGFQTKKRSLWSAVAIHRILKNEIYIGNLVQGKRTSPNYKVKKTILREREECIITENAHEAIISPSQFDLVQKLMSEDTRSPKGASCVHPFSGKITCADCGSAMVRNVFHGKKAESPYFICSGYKKDSSSCTSHLVKESLIYDTVLAVLQAHIAAALDMDSAMQRIDALAWENRELARIDKEISFQEEIIDKNQRMKLGAYEDFRSQILTRDEYSTFRAEFDRHIHDAKAVIQRLNRERNSIKDGLSSQQGWLAQFRSYENIQEISRSVVVSLIDRIVIKENREIEIQLMHKDQFGTIAEFLNEKKNRNTFSKCVPFGREAL